MTNKIKDIHVTESSRGGLQIHVEFNNGWNELVDIKPNGDRFYLASVFRSLANVIEAHEEIDALELDAIEDLGDG